MKESILYKTNFDKETVEKAKALVLSQNPDAFCSQWVTGGQLGNGAGGTKFYVIQRLSNKKDPEGDEREDLGPSCPKEDDAWVYAADRIAK